ncbi:TonB-dependent receptor [Enterovirga sp. GCM10030262]|uniref:TonB-dependent receptor n=1 Tax=Enterovirga sp. GCM10030262 TaxID=3273391 RepID=UPI003614A715
MRKSFWLVSAGVLALASPAYAQPAEDEVSPTAQSGAVDDTGIAQTETAVRDDGDIIVTATRRNQALSDVPLAVSAVSGESMQNSGAADIRQLQQLSPSLLVSSTQSEAGASSARIRGVGTVGDNPGLESSVAVFIDGVYRSRNGTALTELGPVERVEVLRGPQGTLFGRNASAGIISVITARPKFEHEGRAEFTYGNYDFMRAELGVTGPISESVAYRLDGVYLERDGYLKDVISERRVNDRDRYLIRGQLLFEPSDALSVRLIGDYAKRDEECCGAVYLPARDSVSDGSGGVLFEPSSIAALERALGATILDDPFERDVAITPGRNYRQDVEDWGVSAEAVYDFGGAELTSISAYRSNDYVRGQDADYNNLDILFRDDDGGSQQRFRTFTQELRLQGEAFDGRLDWLVGGYYAHEKLTVIDNLSFGNDYQRYANCVLAGGLSQQLSAAFGTPINLVQPVGGVGCFNQATIGGLLPLIPAEDPRRGLLALLGGLVPGVPLGGFDAVGAVLGAGLGLPPLTINNVGANDRYDQKSRNFAFFTHNIIEITDRVDLTLGLRYTNERKTLDATLTDNNLFCRVLAASPFAALAQLPCVVPSVPGGSFTQENVRNKEDALSGTAVLSFKPNDDLLTYISYSRGYKAGGFNLDRSALMRQGGIGPVTGTASLEGLIFEPENVDAFEIGAKYNGPGFDLNVTAFHQVFDDFQLNTFNGLFFEVANVNACKDDLGGADTDNDPATGACPGGVKGGVKSKGVEVEAFMRPIDNLGVNLGATVVDTKYRRNLVGIDGQPLSNALFQLPGRRLSNSSLWTLTGSLTYTPPLGDSGLTGLFYVDARYQSQLNTGSDLDLEKLQDEYFVMNARVGVRGRDDRWGIELWAQNLLDEDYQQIAFDAPIQGSGTIRGIQQGFYPRANQLFGSFLAEPRTYGVTVRTRF